MSSAPAAETCTEFERIPLRRISEGYNSRKKFDERELAELGEDIKKRCLLQAVMVRPKGDGYELVVGARRLRASKLAGLDTILARVVVMTDAEAAEANVAENIKREDLGVLEVADAYRALKEEHGYSAEKIAERVGKSLSAVYAGLKLCSASEEVREAVENEGLPASHAGLLARLPASRQPEALTALRDAAFGEGWCSFEEAEAVVRNSFMRELKGAPFDRTKPLAGAGPCSLCPKRAGNMGEEAKGRADVCTDVSCFAAKARVAGEEMLAAARQGGMEVLEGKKAQHAMHGRDYVDLSSRCYEVPGGVKTTWGEVLEKYAPDVHPSAVAVVEGAAVPVLPRKEALAALANAGQKWAKEELKYDRQSSMDSFREGQARRQREVKLRRQVVREVLSTIEKRVELERADFLIRPELWRLVARLALLRAGHDGLKTFAARREMEEGGCAAKPGVEKLLKSLDSARMLSAVALELLVVDDADGGSYRSTYNDGMKALASYFGIDLKKLEAGVRAAEKAKKKPQKAAAGPEESTPAADAVAWRLTSGKKAHALDAAREGYARCGATMGSTVREYKKGDRVCPKCAKAAGGPPPEPVVVTDSRKKKR